MTGLGLTPTDDVLVLTGLSATLFPGTTLAITFRFATAGTITLQVPVMLTTSAITPLSVPPLPSESAARLTRSRPGLQRHLDAAAGFCRRLPLSSAR